MIWLGIVVGFLLIIVVNECVNGCPEFALRPSQQQYYYPSRSQAANYSLALRPRPQGASSFHGRFSKRSNDLPTVSNGGWHSVPSPLLGTSSHSSCPGAPSPLKHPLSPTLEEMDAKQSWLDVNKLSVLSPSGGRHSPVPSSRASLVGKHRTGAGAVWPLTPLGVQPPSPRQSSRTGCCSCRHCVEVSSVILSTLR
jgi:hypothetical protein